MLQTVRLFFIATALALVAVVMTARGLVSEPEFRTRIGEVPSVGRPLMQQALAPLSEVDRLSILAASRRAEEIERLHGLTGTAEISADAASADGAPAPIAAAGGSPTTHPAVPEPATVGPQPLAGRTLAAPALSQPAGEAAGPATAGTAELDASTGTAEPTLSPFPPDQATANAAQTASSDPLGELIRATLPLTPEPRRQGEGEDATPAAEPASENRPPALAFGSEQAAAGRRLGPGGGAPEKTAAVPEKQAIKPGIESNPSSGKKDAAADGGRKGKAKRATSSEAKKSKPSKRKTVKQGAAPARKTEPEATRKAAEAERSSLRKAAARAAARKKARLARKARLAKRARAQQQAATPFNAQAGTTYPGVPAAYPSFYTISQP